MISALRFLFESENADRVVHFLGTRKNLAQIIAPDWVRIKVQASVAADAASAIWSSSDESPALISDTATNIVVIAEDAIQERTTMASIVPRKGQKVRGLFNHIMPALVCELSGFAPRFSVAGLKRYAVLCVPRSGSSYLSALLSNAGVGAPKEHIREPLAYIVTEGKLGFAAAIEQLEKVGQRNGIFGTKLISTFLIKASGNNWHTLKSNIHWMEQRGYRFVRLNRPLPDAVISSYIAFLMRKWHFFGELDPAMRAKLDTLVFENGAAWDEYIRFRAEKAIVDSIADLNRMPTVEYSELYENAGGTVATMCRHINVDPGELQSGSVRMPVATRAESHTYGIFSERLADLIEMRKHEIELKTLKKISSIAGMDVKAAQKLIENYL